MFECKFLDLFLILFYVNDSYVKCILSKGSNVMFLYRAGKNTEYLN